MPKRFYGILMIALLFAGTIAEAQNRYHFYYGKVFDQVTKRPIPNVDLSLVRSKTGTVTDRSGSFSFYADSIPATLVVSHVGYQTKTVLLDETSFSLSLYLSGETRELEEVEIKAKANEPYFKDEHYAVLDYEIADSLVYLLIYRQRMSKSELICKNLTGDTVARSEPFTFSPVRLFRDCLGTLHVLSRDSGFQVYRHGINLDMIHAVKLKKFEDVLKNCVASTAEILYFQKVTDRGLGVEYYGVNKKNLVRHSISNVKDEKKLKMLRRNAEDNFWLGNAKQPDSHEDFVTWNYVNKILYRPIKTTLYRVGSFICIFNTPEHQMEFYDSIGNYSYKLALNVDKVSDGRWTDDILVDGTDGRVYTTFLRNGICSVYAIDLNSGNLKKKLSLEHSFPQKVQIYNGWVYYLYNVPGDADNKMLFRQKF